MYERNNTKSQMKNLQKNWQTKLIKMTVWFVRMESFFFDQLKNLTTIEIIGKITSVHI